MFKYDGKYGSIHIDGETLDIDKIKITELDKYIEKLKMKRIQIVEQQNEYLSKIIN